MRVRPLSADERARRNQLANEAIKRRRNALIEQLAPDLRCAECGAQFDHPSLLEVDHVNGAGFSHRAMSSGARVARYRREHREGVELRALCRSCSGRDGRMRQLAIAGAVKRRARRG